MHEFIAIKGVYYANYFLSTIFFLQACPIFYFYYLSRMVAVPNKHYPFLTPNEKSFKWKRKKVYKFTASVYVKTFIVDKFNYLCIIEFLGEQVQTLASVSFNDLGRMSPCSLSVRKQQTRKPIALTVLYADVFAFQNQKEVL